MARTSSNSFTTTRRAAETRWARTCCGTSWPRVWCRRPGLETNWLVYTTAFLLAPVAAGAERLSYGVGYEVYWTDNVYGTSDDEIDDTSLRALPWGQLEDTDGDFSGSLRYGPSYDYYLQESN